MRRELLLSLLTSALISLSFPPLKLGFFAYVGLIPFFYLLQDKNFKESVRWGYITGFFTNLGTLYWINWVTIPGAIAAILYLPVYFIVYAVLHTFLRQHIKENYFYYCLPFLWTGVEFLRSLGVLGFPWNSLAYSQTYYLSLIQYASYTSLFGVSFWIVTINVFILLIFKNASHYKRLVIYFMVLILLFLIPWIYGKLIIPDEDQGKEEKIRVGIIQGNIDPYLKWDDAFQTKNLLIYQHLTQSLKNQNLDLIIWPETATPVYLRDSITYLNVIYQITDNFRTSLITGTPDYQFLPDHTYKAFNAAFLFTPGKKGFQVYRKTHLVPFGERVPFTETFPFLKDFLESLEMGEGDFSPGEDIVLFNVPTLQRDDGSEITQAVYKIPVIICFESLFSNLVRQFVIKGADVLVIITNDAWFGPTSAPYHHAQAAVFRAIENRISIARCANTGVSMFIDAYGRISKETPIFERCVITNEMSLRKSTTFFTRYGHIFTISISLFNLIPFSLAFKKWLKNHLLNKPDN